MGNGELGMGNGELGIGHWALLLRFSAGNQKAYSFEFF